MLARRSPERAGLMALVLISDLGMGCFIDGSRDQHDAPCCVPTSGRGPVTIGNHD